MALCANLGSFHFIRLVTVSDVTGLVFQNSIQSKWERGRTGDEETSWEAIVILKLRH